GLLLGEVLVLVGGLGLLAGEGRGLRRRTGGGSGGMAVACRRPDDLRRGGGGLLAPGERREVHHVGDDAGEDRKSTRLNSSHVSISYAVFCLKKKKALQ